MELTGEAAIAHRALELRNQGKVDESRALLRTIPLSPAIAESIKHLEGAAGVKRLLTGGYNLSEVEAAFGKDWFTR
jgi:hypothetical protein